MAHRIDGADTVAAPPGLETPGTPGYFRNSISGPPGTEIDGDWLNMVQEEIGAVAVLRGAALSTTHADYGQMSTALAHTQALTGAAADTTNTSTYWTRSLLAATSSQSTGAASAIVASDSSGATGARSAVIASGGGNAGGAASAVIASTNASINASAGDSAIMATAGNCDIGSFAERSAIIASNTCDIGDGALSFNSVVLASLNCNLDASRAAVIACHGNAADDVSNLGATTVVLATTGSTAGSGVTSVANTAAASFIAASDAVTMSGVTTGAVLASAVVTLDTTGDNAAIIASASESSQDPAITSTASQAAVIACAGRAVIGGTATEAAIIASRSTSLSDNVEVTGNRSAIIGVNGPMTLSGNRSVVIASSTTGVFTFSENDTLAGVAGTAATWKLNSATGKATLLKLRLDDDDTSTAGSPPTLSNLPAAEVGGGTQHTWLKIDIDGTTCYIPAWD